jgi:hypothetical protein
MIHKPCTGLIGGDIPESTTAFVAMWPPDKNHSQPSIWTRSRPLYLPCHNTFGLDYGRIAWTLFFLVAGFAMDALDTLGRLMCSKLRYLYAHMGYSPDSLLWYVCIIVLETSSQVRYNVWRTLPTNMAHPTLYNPVEWSKSSSRQDSSSTYSMSSHSDTSSIRFSNIPLPHTPSSSRTPSESSKVLSTVTDHTINIPLTKPVTV